MKTSNTVLMGLFLSITYVIFVQASPAGDTLEPVKKEIKEKFIDIDSAEVAQDLKKEGKPVISESFQKYVEKNEKAKKVFQVYRDGTGEFSMQVINLEDDINKKFEAKTSELHGNTKSATQKELLAKSMFGIGTLIISGAILYTTNFRGSLPVGGGLIAGGVAMDIASAIIWSKSLEAQSNSRAHLEQNIIMHEKWRNQFSEAKKQRCNN